MSSSVNQSSLKLSKAMSYLRQAKSGQLDVEDEHKYIKIKDFQVVRYGGEKEFLITGNHPNAGAMYYAPEEKTWFSI